MARAAKLRATPRAERAPVMPPGTTGVLIAALPPDRPGMLGPIVGSFRITRAEAAEMAQPLHRGLAAMVHLDGLPRATSLFEGVLLTADDVSETPAAFEGSFRFEPNDLPPLRRADGAPVSGAATVAVVLGLHVSNCIELGLPG